MLKRKFKKSLDSIGKKIDLLQDLLRKVLIDKCGLLAQRVNRVYTVFLFRDRLLSSFINL